MFKFGLPRFLFEGDGEGASGGAAPAAAAPALSAEALAEITARTNEAIATAVKQANEEAETRHKAANEAQARKIRAALGENTSVEDVNARVMEKFLESPADVLTALATNVSERTRREVLDQIEEERAIQREQRAAYSETLKSRPDIRGNEAAMEQLDLIYKHETDPNLSIKERFRAAVATFDRRVEAVGAPKAEDRIKAALPLKTTPTSGGDEKSKAEVWRERQSEALKTEANDRIERYKRTHGGQRPPSVVRR